MALQAESADVCEIAFASAFDDGNDMVSVPEGFSEAAAQAPVEEGFQACGAAQALDAAFGFEAVDAALSANAAVALQDFFAEIAGIAAQPPFFHAPIGAKGPAAGGDLEITPAA